jgi:polyphosphate kinase 2 (PPK2 family)
MSMNLSKYRIKPGSKVDLKKWDPDDRSASADSKEEDHKRLTELGVRLNKLQDILYAERRHAVLVVLQGMDTSGKDGTIRHVFSEVDAPGKGEVVIFNRSHYEDVLVVRVHKLITATECKRRYAEINHFERLLADTATVILKFYLHISKDEQRRRLQERLDDPNKQWKFSRADLAERKLWSQYMRAYADALEATSTDQAPWYVVPANSKTNRNLFISSVLLDTLEGLKMRYPRPRENLDGIVLD